MSSSSGRPFVHAVSYGMFSCTYAVFQGMCFMHIYAWKTYNKKLHAQMVQKLFSHTFSYFDSSWIITSGRMRKNNNSTWNTQCKTQLYHTLPLRTQHKIMIGHVCDFSQLLPREGWFSPHSNQQAANQMEILTSHDRPSVDAPWQQ
jgi:hypothetical protein